jgi:nucleoside-diphosphate-sugar epimerase
MSRNRFDEFRRALAAFGSEASLCASRFASVKRAADFAARRRLGTGAMVLYSTTDRPGIDTRIDHLRRLRVVRAVIGVVHAVRRRWRAEPMKVLLTGGAGDLGQTLVSRLRKAGDTAVVLDVREPTSDTPFIHGSVLDRAQLPDWLNSIDAIVHIAAWHGIHEFRGEKDAYDFFDLNVRGTFEVFEAASRAGVRNIVHISTTSLHRDDTLYARSKIIAERIAADYAAHNGMNVITLRPRGFIPHWNRTVYTSYRDWAAWFWKGAVHIDDVAQAVTLSLKLLGQGPLTENPVLTLDSAYEYTDADLAHWDIDGPGTSFRKYYPQYYDLARSFDLDPATKPFKLDIAETVRRLGYRPTYSLGSLLRELASYGDAGPPQTP